MASVFGLQKLSPGSALGMLEWETTPRRRSNIRRFHLLKLRVWVSPPTHPTPALDFLTHYAECNIIRIIRMQYFSGCGIKLIVQHAALLILRIILNAALFMLQHCMEYSVLQSRRSRNLADPSTPPALRQAVDAAEALKQARRSVGKARRNARRSRDFTVRDHITPTPPCTPSPCGTCARTPPSSPHPWHGRDAPVTGSWRTRDGVDVRVVVGGPVRVRGLDRPHRVLEVVLQLLLQLVLERVPLKLRRPPAAVGGRAWLQSPRAPSEPLSVWTQWQLWPVSSRETGRKGPPRFGSRAPGRLEIC